jgi:hypothetical protein
MPLLRMSFTSSSIEAGAGMDKHSQQKAIVNKR